MSVHDEYRPVCKKCGRRISSWDEDVHRHGRCVQEPIVDKPKTPMPEIGIIDRCLVETYKHVAAVRHYMGVFIRDLMKRAEHHDESKFVEPELTPFAEATHKLATMEYGSPEYAQSQKDLAPTLQAHYSKNRHHPEHFPNGVDDMTLVDLLEMLSDWKAATSRNKAGNIRKSIELNAERFKMSPQLKRIFENTVREYFTE